MLSSREGFTALWGPLVRIAHGMLGDRHDAEDCVAEAMAQVWAQQPTDVVNPNAYLTTLVHRRALDRLRERARHALPTQDLVAIEPTARSLPWIEPVDIAENVARADEGRWLDVEAQRLLEPQSYELVRMVDAHGATVTAAANVLGISRRNATQLLGGARRRLRAVHLQTLGLLGLAVGVMRRKAIAAGALVATAMAVFLVAAPGQSGQAEPEGQKSSHAGARGSVSRGTDASAATSAAAARSTGEGAGHRRSASPSRDALLVTPGSGHRILLITGPAGNRTDVEQNTGGSGPQDGPIQAVVDCVNNMQVNLTMIGC